MTKTGKTEKFSKKVAKKHKKDMLPVEAEQGSPEAMRPAFMLGEGVKHKVGRSPGILTGIMIRQNGFLYYVTFHTMEEKACQAFELESTDPKDSKKTIGLDPSLEEEPEGTIGFGLPKKSTAAVG